MFYIVYKTINLVNNKFYIGKHYQTIDPHQFDGYYGSGSQIINAVTKYGKENFIRETLFVFDNEADCLLKEEETVAPHLGKPYCYNMRSGGIGGFEHINSIPKEDRPNIKSYKRKIASGELKVGGTQNWTEETYNKVRETGWSELVEMGIVNPNTWEGYDTEELANNVPKIFPKKFQEAIMAITAPRLTTILSRKKRNVLDQKI